MPSNPLFVKESKRPVSL